MDNLLVNLIEIDDTFSFDIINTQTLEITSFDYQFDNEEFFLHNIIKNDISFFEEHFNTIKIQKLSEILK